MRSLGERFIDDLTQGAEMTADQQRLLPIGQRLGFEELPGMRGRADSPGRLWMSSYMSLPYVRYAVQDTLDANAGIIERLFQRAIGAPAGSRYGTQSFAAARAATGAEFNAVRDSLPEVLELPGGIIESLQKVRGIAPELETVIEEGGRITRDDLFALRSDLNLLASDLSTAPGKRLIGNRVAGVSTMLDDWINNQLGRDMAQRWQRARVRYLVQELAQKPGVMQPDGSLSWKSARNVLNREMPDAYRQVMENARGRLGEEVSDFMDAVDYAGAFGDLVGNSGTATRQALGKMSAVDLLRGQALRFYLRRERDKLNAARYAE
jgi:hypothetical protein